MHQTDRIRSHRATTIDTNTKVNKLQGFINPVKAQWKTNETRTLIRSYSGFCEQLALDKAQSYLVKHDANSINDWGTHELDAEGLALQSELEERLKVCKASFWLFADLFLTGR